MKLGKGTDSKDSAYSNMYVFPTPVGPINNKFDLSISVLWGILWSSAM